MPATDYDATQFFDGLVRAGLIVPVGVPGVFGRNHVFEDVLERFNALVSQVAKDDGAEYFVFPPIIDRKVLEKSDYLDSFPHLAGTVFSFFGKELDARKLSERVGPLVLVLSAIAVGGMLLVAYQPDTAGSALGVSLGHRCLLGFRWSQHTPGTIVVQHHRCGWLTAG